MKHKINIGLIFLIHGLLYLMSAIIVPGSMEITNNPIAVSYMLSVVALFLFTILYRRFK
jgi:hypothetical protein